MPRPIHFEIPADNPDRAAAFYKDVFGWKFDKWEGGSMPYWLITTGGNGEPGIGGGLLPRQHPGASTVNTIGVSSVDESVRTIESRGGPDRRSETGDPRDGLAGVLHGHRGEHLRHHAGRRIGEVTGVQRASVATRARSTFPPETIATVRAPCGARIFPARRAAVAAAPEPST